MATDRQTVDITVEETPEVPGTMRECLKPTGIEQVKRCPVVVRKKRRIIVDTS